MRSIGTSKFLGGPGTDTPQNPAADLRLRLGLAVLAFMTWTVFAAVHAHIKPADFYVFWAAARHIEAPYDPAVITQLQAALHIDGAWPFVYPPTFLLAAWPFAQLPLELAYPLWTGLISALFFFAASFMVRPPWATLALFIVPPVVLAISPGQTSMLIGAAAIGGFQLLKRRPVLAGVLFGLAACIKPQAMILAPIVLWGHGQAMRWSLITGLGLVLASFVFGPARWIEWVQAIGDFRNVVPATERVNPSALIDSPWWMAALGLLGAWLAWRLRDLSGLVAGALCLTPYAHQYDLAPLAPLALMWLSDWRSAGLGKAAAGAGLLAGLVATPLAGLIFLITLAAASAPWKGSRGEETPPRILTSSYEA